MSNITQFPIPAIPISQVSPVSAATLTDSFVVVQSGTTGLETLTQVLNLFLSNLFLNCAGNPNGNIAGTKNQVCYDTIDNILWVCTVTGTATSAVWRTCIPALSDGQILIGGTSLPVAGNLIGGTGITITKASNNITISAAPSDIIWNNVTSGSAIMIANSGYICDGSSTTALTLPTTSSIGDLLFIQGYQHGWNIIQNDSQQILISPSATTVGASGSVTSTSATDTLVLCCISANIVWSAQSVTGAGLTIV